VTQNGGGDLRGKALWSIVATRAILLEDALSTEERCLVRLTSYVLRRFLFPRASARLSNDRNEDTKKTNSDENLESGFHLLLHNGIRKR
jgi:hypothetical protein